MRPPILPPRTDPPPEKAELLAESDVTERQARTLAARWGDSMPAPVRLTLLQMANRHLRLLMRAGLRR